MSPLYSNPLGGIKFLIFSMSEESMLAPLTVIHAAEIEKMGEKSPSIQKTPCAVDLWFKCDYWIRFQNIKFVVFITEDTIPKKYILELRHFMGRFVTKHSPGKLRIMVFIFLLTLSFGFEIRDFKEECNMSYQVKLSIKNS